MGTRWALHGPGTAIEALLLSHNFEIEVSRAADDGLTNSVNSAGKILRDKRSIGRGESIVDFMKRGAKSTKVVLIHSDRYWTSVNCIYELYLLQNELVDKSEKSFATTVIPIELPNSRIRDSEKLKEYLDYWDKFPSAKKSVPTRMIDVGWGDLNEVVMNSKFLISAFGKRISGDNDLNLKWSIAPSALLEQVRMRLHAPARSEPVDA